MKRNKKNSAPENNVKLDEEKNDVENLQMKAMINKAFLGFDLRFKKHIDDQVTILTERIFRKLEDIVETKYESIHRDKSLNNISSSKYRTPNSSCNTTEDVIKAVQLVITPSEIDQNINKFMKELAELRL